MLLTSVFPCNPGSLMRYCVIQLVTRRISVSPIAITLTIFADMNYAVAKLRVVEVSGAGPRAEQKQRK